MNFQLLKEFESLCSNICENKIGQLISDDCIEICGNSDELLAMTAIVHGNEPGGILFFNRLLNAVLTQKIIPKYRVRLILGNREAFLENKRSLNRDLNRCFSDIIIDQASVYEWKKAIAIKDQVKNAKYLIDIHQTQDATETDFFIFPKAKKNIVLAHALNMDSPIVLHDLEFSKDGDTVDTWASKQGIAAITYEMGEKSFDEAQTDKLFKGVLEFLFSSNIDVNVDEDFLTWGQTVMNSPSIELKSGLQNFSQIKKGDIIASINDSDANTDTIVAECDGYVLFPKYGQQAKSSSELCRVLKKV